MTLQYAKDDGICINLTKALATEVNVQ